MKESLFFRREIAEKGLELLGVLGVDQYLDIDEIGQQNEEQQQEEDYEWQSVDYQIRYPTQEASSTMKQQILLEYKQIRGIEVALVKQIAHQVEENISFHWLIRQKEALVDCFQFTAIEKEGNKVLLQLLRKTDKANRLMEVIGQANTRWEYDGVYISAAFPQQQHCHLVVRLKQSSFTCTIGSLIENAQELILIIKASIIERIFNNQVASYLTIYQPFGIKDKLQRCQPRQLINLVYCLHNNLGLTLSMKNNQIEEKLLSKSNQLNYHRSIYYIAQRCTNQSIHSQHILRIAECQQAEVDAAFKQLYSHSLSQQQSEDDIQTL